jgi:hypothetical protein
LGNHEQPVGFVVITYVDTKHIANGEIVIGSLGDANLITGSHFTLDDDSQVSTRPQCLCEAAWKSLIIHPNSKPPARDARLGNLENRRPDLPMLSDERLVRVDPFRCEVFAKLAGCKRSADLTFPPARVFDGVCVDRFIGPPMGLAIRLVISGKVDTLGRDPSEDRRFPDSAPGRATVVIECAYTADVDGENLSRESRHEPPSFQVRPTVQSAFNPLASSALLFCAEVAL